MTATHIPQGTSVLEPRCSARQIILPPHLHLPLCAPGYPYFSLEISPQVFHEYVLAAKFAMISPEEDLRYVWLFLTEC